MKRSKIVLDAFTFQPLIHKAFPLVEAMRNIPEWWKTMPKSIKQPNPSVPLSHNVATIKGCSGLIDLYASGFMMNLWCDVALRTNTGITSHEFADGINLITQHSRHQMPESFLRNHTQFKITPPWVIKEKTGIKFFVTSPTWNRVPMQNTFDILPGIIDFKHQVSTNLNFLLPQNEEYFLEAGTPLAHWIPLSDKKIIINNELIDDKQFMKIYNEFLNNQKFVGSYRDLKKRCPFH
jgi:hypothetical protein